MAVSDDDNSAKYNIAAHIPRIKHIGNVKCIHSCIVTSECVSCTLPFKRGVVT
jgi:hypothetical protein